MILLPVTTFDFLHPGVLAGTQSAAGIGIYF